MPYVAVLGCGPGGHVPGFSGLLLCFVTQNNDAGVLVGETGQPSTSESNFHIWKQSWLGAARETRSPTRSVLDSKVIGHRIVEIIVFGSFR